MGAGRPARGKWRGPGLEGRRSSDGLSWGMGRVRWGWETLEAAPPPRGLGRWGAQMPSAPSLRRRPLRASPCQPGPPLSSGGQHQPPPLGDRPELGPALGPPRCVGPAAAPLARTILPIKVARKQAAWPGAGSGCGVPVIPTSGLFVRRRFAPLSLRPSPLPPLVGTAPLDQAPLDQAFCLSSSSHCWKGPEFSASSPFLPRWHSRYSLLPRVCKDRGALC